MYIYIYIYIYMYLSRGSYCAYVLVLIIGLLTLYDVLYSTSSVLDE
jgi:hypothetical protein